MHYDLLRWMSIQGCLDGTTEAGFLGSHTTSMGAIFSMSKMAIRHRTGEGQPTRNI